MNKILYITHHTLKAEDGIAKKIISQAESFSKIYNCCILLCFESNNIVAKTYINGFEQNHKILKKCSKNSESANIMNNNKLLLKYANQYIKSISLCYIRLMIPNMKLINLLRNMKKLNIKIGYEIQTYPFFYEQIKITSNKIRGIVKVLLFTIHFPIINYYVNNFFVIKSRDNVKMYKKMIPIVNGVSDDILISNNERKDSNMINFIGVGTIMPYHGYDRLIKSIAKYCNTENKKFNVEFHIVGESDEIDRLKNLAKKLNISNIIIFHGKQFGNDLEKLYASSDIGVGTLYLKDRNANIDTAIKNIEYLAKGLFIISSGQIPNIDKRLYYKVPMNLDIDIKTIIKEYTKYQKNSDLKLEETIINHRWSVITKKIIDKLEDKL